MPQETPPPADLPAENSQSWPRDLLLAPGRGWFRALRHPQFRFFWVGNFISNIGSWMQTVAQGWLVYELTGSPFWLGLIGFVQQVPSLIFSLPAGVVADRASRRQVLLVTQAVMMALALILALLVSLRVVMVQHIVVLAFLAGTTMAFNAPTYQAAVRDLVNEEDTLNAIALNSMQFNLSRVLGPSVAGVFIALAGVAMCFYLNALSYVVLLFVILRVQFPPRAAQARNGSFRADMAEAMRYVQQHSDILTLILIVAIISTFGLPYLTLMPAFAQDVLHAGPKGLGYLVASAGVGALLGGLNLARMQHGHRRGLLVLSAAMVFFAAILLFSLSRNLITSAVLLAIAGAGMVNSAATVNSLIQNRVPDAIRGRVLSMHTMAFLGFTPLGSLLVGWVAEKSSPPTALALSSGFALLVMMALAATRRARPDVGA
jgi:MFS family permease